MSVQRGRMIDLPLPDPARGVFETLLVARGLPVELEAHLERLGVSARELYGLALPDAAAELACERAAGVELGRLRLTLTPTPGAEGAPPSVDAVLQPVARPTVLPGWELALDLRTVSAGGWRGSHKWADRRTLEALDARAAPEAALLVDADGSALETTRANLFAVGSDGVLRTPPLDGRVLPGIARGRVAELARASGIELREERLTLRKLLAARELFATGSVRGVEPIRSLDGAAIGEPGTGRGPVTTTLADALRRAWLGEPVGARG